MHAPDLEGDMSLHSTMICVEGHRVHPERLIDGSYINDCNKREDGTYITMLDQNPAANY